MQSLRAQNQNWNVVMRVAAVAANATHAPIDAFCVSVDAQFFKSASEWRAHNGWRVALLIVCVCDTKVGLLIDLPPND